MKKKTRKWTEKQEREQRFAVICQQEGLEEMWRRMKKRGLLI